MNNGSTPGSHAHAALEVNTDNTINLTSIAGV